MRRAGILAAGRSLSAAAALILTMGAAPAAAEEDLDVGARVFQRECGSCHMIGAGAHSRVGPPLNGILDRKAGTQDDFRYSKGMVRAGVDGVIWTVVSLDGFLENPKSVVSRSRMSYRGLKSEEDRAALIAFLASHSASPSDIPESSPRVASVDAPAELLAIQGDPAYGEYLASECTTCHQLDGADEGIPSVVGWPEDDFKAALHAYRAKKRPHPVMQMIARSLGDEEIAALAAYFGAVEAQ